MYYYWSLNFWVFPVLSKIVFVQKDLLLTVSNIFCGLNFFQPSRSFSRSGCKSTEMSSYRPLFRFDVVNHTARETNNCYNISLHQLTSCVRHDSGYPDQTSYSCLLVLRSGPWACRLTTVNIKTAFLLAILTEISHLVQETTNTEQSTPA